MLYTNGLTKFTELSELNSFVKYTPRNTKNIYCKYEDKLITDKISMDLNIKKTFYIKWSQSTIHAPSWMATVIAQELDCGNSANILQILCSLFWTKLTSRV